MNRLIVLALFVVISAVCAEQTSHGVCFYCFHSTTHIQIERLQLVSCVGKKSQQIINVILITAVALLNFSIVLPTTVYQQRCIHFHLLSPRAQEIFVVCLVILLIE
jgi:hypothetical protein